MSTENLKLEVVRLKARLADLIFARKVAELAAKQSPSTSVEPEQSAASAAALNTAPAVTSAIHAGAVSDINESFESDLGDLLQGK
jgi:hypothetical protein